MPKNKVSDPITDQEIAFVHLVRSGTMTDRRAAKAVGLNPDSADYLKAKPRVRDYMLGCRATVEQQLAQQEGESQPSLNREREQVLTRLWEIANLSSEMTRGSITGQVKAISMIVAIQGLIPGRHTRSAEEKPALTPQIHAAAWPTKQQSAIIDGPQPAPAPAQQEDSPAAPHANFTHEPAPGSVVELPPDPEPSHSTFANPFIDGRKTTVRPACFESISQNASYQGMTSVMP